MKRFARELVFKQRQKTTRKWPIAKDEIINNDSSAGQREKKKKIWVPLRNRTHDLPNAGRALYPLSHHFHDGIDIADPSSMQDACHMWTQFNGLALHEFSLLSG